LEVKGTSPESWSWTARHRIGTRGALDQVKNEAGHGGRIMRTGRRGALRVGRSTSRGGYPVVCVPEGPPEPPQLCSSGTADHRFTLPSCEAPIRARSPAPREQQRPAHDLGHAPASSRPSKEHETAKTRIFMKPSPDDAAAATLRSQLRDTDGKDQQTTERSGSSARPVATREARWATDQG